MWQDAICTVLKGKTVTPSQNSEWCLNVMVDKKLLLLELRLKKFYLLKKKHCFRLTIKIAVLIQILEICGCLQDRSFMVTKWYNNCEKSYTGQWFNCLKGNRKAVWRIDTIIHDEKHKHHIFLFSIWCCRSMTFKYPSSKLWRAFPTWTFEDRVSDCITLNAP